MNTIHINNNFQNSITLIPDFFIDHHLAKASGEFVKVYLYIQRQLKTKADLQVREIADSLYMTEADVNRAIAYWQTQGVLDVQEAASYGASAPSAGTYGNTAQNNASYGNNAQNNASYGNNAQNNASYGNNAQPTGYAATALEPAAQSVPVKENLSPVVVSARMEEEGLSHLAFMADTYLGKPLTQTELNTLFYFYDRLHFPVELIEYLLEYCVSNNKKSMRYIETVAISWYEQGIDTIEKAKDAMVIYNKNYYAVMKAFGLSSRNPGPAEATFIKKWLEEYRFDLNIILEACNRTLSSISQPSFPYTDTILGRWKKAGVHTLEDIKTLDNQFAAGKKAPAHKPLDQQIATAKNRFHNFEQRDYNYQDLEQQFIRQVNGIPEPK